MTMVQATVPEPIGRIGRFAILAELPAGGMARVFLSKKDGANELCVLKQLHVELEKHPTAATRLKREAHLVSHLNHPNIARIVDAGVEDGTFCTATEFVAGQMLESIMEALARDHSMLPPAFSVYLAAQMLEGLDHAHNLSDPNGVPLKIVHRDLSPRNVMVGYRGEVKIIDFGVAHGKIDDFKTAPGMMVGTLRYMAPEQALTRQTDQRTDLYTVAVVLYEMLTGVPVIKEGKAIQVLTSVIEHTPTPAHLQNPILPRALGEVVAKGYAKDPSVRWQTAREFKDALVEASRSFSRPTREHLGRLVRELFPGEAREAEAFAALAQRLRTHERGPETGKGIVLQTEEPSHSDNAMEPPSAPLRREYGAGTRSDQGDPHDSRLTDDLPLLSGRYFAPARAVPITGDMPMPVVEDDEAPPRWDDPTTKASTMDKNQAVVASESEPGGQYSDEASNEATPAIGYRAQPDPRDTATDTDSVPMPAVRTGDLGVPDRSDTPTPAPLGREGNGRGAKSFDASAFASTSPSWGAGADLLAPNMPVRSDPDLFRPPSSTDADTDTGSITRTTVPMLDPAAAPTPLVEVPSRGPIEETREPRVEQVSPTNYVEALEGEVFLLRRQVRFLKALVFGLLLIAGVLLGVTGLLMLRGKETPELIRATSNPMDHEQESPGRRR